MDGEFSRTKRTKRFVLSLKEYKLNSKDVIYSWYEFNTLEELKSEVELIKEIYEESKYEYLAVDYNSYQFILYDGTIFPSYELKFLKRNIWMCDKYLRKPNEIPENYIWDDGEYEGWLQFRWGNGKNAVGYKKEKVAKNNKLDVEIDSYYDLLEQTAINEEEKDKKNRKFDKW